MKKRLKLIIEATTKKNKLPTRIVLAAFGVLMMGFGMSVIEKLNFGTDPYTCLNNGLSMHTGISLGTWGLIVSAVIAVFVVIFGAEKIGLGTLFNMVGFGYSIDLFRFIWKAAGLETIELDFIPRVLLLALMLFIFILAVSLYLASDLGCAPYDAAPEIISEKSKIKFVFVRMAWDVCAVVGGALLGSAIGATTLVCALGVGPAASFVKRKVDRLLNK
jgi:uncharacterized membrane protein YczE